MESRSMPTQSACTRPAETMISFEKKFPLKSIPPLLKQVNRLAVITFPLPPFKSENSICTSFASCFNAQTPNWNTKNSLGLASKTKNFGFRPSLIFPSGIESNHLIGSSRNAGKTKNDPFLRSWLYFSIAKVVERLLDGLIPNAGEQIPIKTNKLIIKYFMVSFF